MLERRQCLAADRSIYWRDVCKAQSGCEIIIPCNVTKRGVYGYQRGVYVHHNFLEKLLYTATHIHLSNLPSVEEPYRGRSLEHTAEASRHMSLRLLTRAL